MEMNIVIIEDLFERYGIVEFKDTTTTVKAKSFNQNIQKDFRIVISIQQEENKYKKLVQKTNKRR